MDILSFLKYIPLWERNTAYSKMILEFKKQLPRHQNRARELPKEEKANILPNSFHDITVIDTSNHKVSITDKDLDIFYNKLNDFNYNWVFFKSYYQEYTRNLNRFNPKPENKNFDIVMIQKILNDNKPIKFLDILIYHLKFRWSFTSKIYRSLKNKNSKKR